MIKKVLFFALIINLSASLSGQSPISSKLFSKDPLYLQKVASFLFIFSDKPAEEATKIIQSIKHEDHELLNHDEKTSIEKARRKALKIIRNSDFFFINSTYTQIVEKLHQEAKKGDFLTKNCTKLLFEAGDPKELPSFLTPTLLQ